MEQELFEAMTRLEMKAAAIEAVAYEAAKFMSILAISKKAQTIVEVGSGEGYSTLWLAYAASVTGGKVITCDIDPAKAEETKTNLAQANMTAYVEVLAGDARDLLRLRDEPVDFIFIDGEPDQYETYFDVVYKQMGTGSMLVADDVIAKESDLSDYVTYVQNHPNLESVTIPLGDGLEISVKTTA